MVSLPRFGSSARLSNLLSRFSILHHQVNQPMPIDRMPHVTPPMYRPLVLQVLLNYAPWALQALLNSKAPWCYKRY
jgi:hypothetical protein